MQEKSSSITTEDLAISEAKDIMDQRFRQEDNYQANPISCSNQNITEWYGFDETNAKLKCEVISSFKLISYKCDILKIAFDADKDAILVDNHDQRILVYPDLKIVMIDLKYAILMNHKIYPLKINL